MRECQSDRKEEVFAMQDISVSLPQRAHPMPCRSFSSTTTQAFSLFSRWTKSPPSRTMSGIVMTPNSVRTDTISCRTHRWSVSTQTRTACIPCRRDRCRVPKQAITCVGAWDSLSTCMNRMPQSESPVQHAKDTHKGFTETGNEIWKAGMPEAMIAPPFCGCGSTHREVKQHKQPPPRLRRQPTEQRRVLRRHYEAVADERHDKGAHRDLRGSSYSA